MKKSTIKKIWIAALALMAFSATFQTVRPVLADDVTPTKPPGRR
jgi:hypothetical protein